MVPYKIYKLIFGIHLYAAAIIGFIPFKVNSAIPSLKFSKLRAAYTVLVLSMSSLPQYYYNGVLQKHVRPEVFENLRGHYVLQFLFTLQYLDRTSSLVIGLFSYLLSAHSMELFFNGIFQLKNEIENLVMYKNFRVVNEIAFIATVSFICSNTIFIFFIMYLITNWDLEIILISMGMCTTSVCSITIENIFFSIIILLDYLFDITNKYLLQETRLFINRESHNFNDSCVLSDLIDKIASLYARLVKLSNFGVEFMGFHCLIIIFSNWIPLLVQVICDL